jgi:hypothetical protein
MDILDAANNLQDVCNQVIEVRSQGCSSTKLTVSSERTLALTVVGRNISMYRIE